MRRLLSAAGLVLLLAVGAATVVRFPVFALVDERAHYAFVQEVAEKGRLPLLGRARISPQVEAIDEGVYPGPPRVDPRTRGLAGFSYEAFQPPLYYVAAAPAFRLAGADHLRKLRVLRGLGLLALLASAALLWRLVSRVTDEPAVFALALTVLLWPGVVVRTVTVSNAALELVLGVAASLALWEARNGRSRRWLLAAGVLVGLGLLTRLTFAAFAPWLLWVAFAYPWRPALAALALPAVLLAPWVASNLDRYGAPTASAVVREMQAPVINPTGRHYGVAQLPDRARALLNGVLAEEWWSEYLVVWKRRVRDVFWLVTLALPLALAVRRARRGASVPWALGLPGAAGLVLMAAATVAGDWDFFYPRYLHVALPAFAVLAALAVPARARGPAAAGLTAAMALLWAHLSTVTPFTP